MAQTVNFTGAVDRDLLRRAKVIAAKTDTSVNALFNAELRYLVETFEATVARACPIVRTNLPPMCRMPANACSTRARLLAMRWLRRFLHSLRGWPGWARRCIASTKPSTCSICRRCRLA